MKQKLSVTVLALSIFNCNILPVQADTSSLESIDNLESIDVQSEATVMGDGQWCVEIPWMGLWCWYL